MIEDLFTPYHLLILFALLFFLFGAKRLPGLGKSLGHGIREFRGGLAGLAADHDDELPPAKGDEPLVATPPETGAQGTGHGGEAGAEDDVVEGEGELIVDDEVEAPKPA